MSKKLKAYEFHLSVQYGNGVKLVAAASKEEAEAMVKENAEDPFDDANWKFFKARPDILTTKKRACILLQMQYRE